MLREGSALEDELKSASLRSLLDKVKDDGEESRGFSLVSADDFADEAEVPEVKPEVRPEPAQEAPKVVRKELKVIGKVSYHLEEERLYVAQQEHKIGPALLNEFVHNGMVYFLMAVLCALAVFKIYQVQKTRDLIASYNEVRTENETLEREWLDLTSVKETLTIHSAIREQATAELKMISPATEDEHVITLR